MNLDPLFLLSWAVFVYALGMLSVYALDQKRKRDRKEREQRPEPTRLTDFDYYEGREQ